MVIETPVEQDNLQKDIENFNGELIPLLGKYSVGLGATAFISPDGRIGARPTLFRPTSSEKKQKEMAIDDSVDSDSEGRVSVTSIEE